MTQALAVANQPRTISGIQESFLTREKVELIKQTIAKGATDTELELFVDVCNRTRLDPFARQIFAVPRYDSNLKRNTFAFQISIDGFRLIAERTGQYRGQTEPEYCGIDGIWRNVWLSDEPPFAARVGVFRAGFEQPLYAIAKFKNYAQTKQDGKLMAMWAKMPDHMIAKCFDEQTEILTTRGFEKFSEVKGKILQVTENGLEPCDAKPFLQQYSGDMIKLESDDLNFCVTPNHDMITTDAKIEAGRMFENSRSRPAYRIPRSVRGSKEHHDIAACMLEITAAYLSDGYDCEGERFKISVSRPYKVEALQEIAGYLSTTISATAGAVAHTPTREITTRSDKTNFFYDYDCVSWLCEKGKKIKADELLKLSREQARIFVDTMIFFDGQEMENGVRRFYTSRLGHLEAFELACVIAGYSVSNRKFRTSDISEKPNYYVTISDRDEIPVVRWGRSYHKTEHKTNRTHTGLEVSKNDSGVVWCVTVPSGEIIVRRKGFSMRCGNCAEALALRKAFPQDLSGLYTPDEAPEGEKLVSGPVVAREPIDPFDHSKIQKLPGQKPREQMTGRERSIDDITSYIRALRAMKDELFSSEDKEERTAFVIQAVQRLALERQWPYTTLTSLRELSNEHLDNFAGWLEGRVIELQERELDGVDPEGEPLP